MIRQLSEAECVIILNMGIAWCVGFLAPAYPEDLLIYGMSDLGKDN